MVVVMMTIDDGCDDDDDENYQVLVIHCALIEEGSNRCYHT